LVDALVTVGEVAAVMVVLVEVVVVDLVVPATVSVHRVEELRLCAVWLAATVVTIDETTKCRC
jgi:hypothetical protein